MVRTSKEDDGQPGGGIQSPQLLSWIRTNLTHESRTPDLWSVEILEEKAIV